MLSQCGIIIEYRVTNPSKKPAATVKGVVDKNILKLFLKPIFSESTREKVFGNKTDAPKIKPAADSITMAKISIEP